MQKQVFTYDCKIILNDEYSTTLERQVEGFSSDDARIRCLRKVGISRNEIKTFEMTDVTVGYSTSDVL